MKTDLVMIIIIAIFIIVVTGVLVVANSTLNDNHQIRKAILESGYEIKAVYDINTGEKKLRIVPLIKEMK